MSYRRTRGGQGHLLFSYVTHVPCLFCLMAIIENYCLMAALHIDFWDLCVLSLHDYFCLFIFNWCNTLFPFCCCDIGKRKVWKSSVGVLCWCKYSLSFLKGLSQSVRIVHVGVIAGHFRCTWKRCVRRCHVKFLVYSLTTWKLSLAVQGSHAFHLGSLSKLRRQRQRQRQRQRERHQTKGLMTGTIALHVHLKSWYIS